MVIYNRAMLSHTKDHHWGSWILVILGLMVAIQMSLNIWKVYRSGRRISEAQKQLDEARKQQSQLQKDLTVVQSPEFIEKEAREKLGMGRPGEVVLILPKFPSAKYEAQSAKEKLATWQQWWKLYVGI